MFDLMPVPSPGCDHPPHLVGIAPGSPHTCCRACKRAWRVEHGLLVPVIYQGWRRAVNQAGGEWEKVVQAAGDTQQAVFQLLMDGSELGSGMPFGYYEHAVTEGEPPESESMSGRGQYRDKMMRPRW